ncbi:haloacid dehalogenase [Francisella halioticida]|uniref:Haloacid dehalogenase n=1 Tax=Francisella halioticida TaxID=549298 RepID=A0ABN5B180_9GAMM|nr:HAD family phosphatase [Francisella halioticida]ASG68307.1 haloacid dehalogenase [Francisella halioticida]BCD91148.1 haloacid dehalogenase [Francisella halioticida]
MLLPIHKNTKLLIFDCDGTIANNMHIHTNAWINVLSERNITTSPANLEKYNGLPSETILKEVFNFNDKQIPIIAEAIKTTSYKLLDKTKPIQPVVDLVKHYYKKLPMVVISGGKKENVYKSLDILELTDLFDEIITADDNHPSKSTPNAFTTLAEKYNLKNQECHVFEDGIPGLINALKAGMTITDVRNINLD